MCVTSVLNLLRPRNGPLVTVSFWSVLVLALLLNQGVAQDAVTAPESPPTVNAAVAAQFANDEVLRQRVVSEGWVQVQAQVRRPNLTAAPTVDAPIQGHPQAAGAADVLFGLPDGSYDSVQFESGTPDLSLRVDAAGLDELLSSPLVAAVVPATSNDMRQLAAGANHSLAIKQDGSLWAWGYNLNGQLGDGSTTGRNVPGQIMTGVVAVAAGANHTLAIKTDGSLWAWGYNGNGQLGDGSTTQRLRAVPVLDNGRPMTGVVAVAAGANHSVAIKTDGSLWAWGLNGDGQIGNGTTVRSLIPVRVIDGGTSAVAVGATHTLALKTDGTLWGWGRNANGQIGKGDTYNRLSPVSIMTGVRAVAAGDSHSLAIKTDGTLRAWGANARGQLGDNSTTDRLAPIQVQGLTGVTEVAAGDLYSLARKTDGSLWAWGYNDVGRLGDGTTTQRLLPVRVSVLNVVTAMDGGAGHSLALRPDGTLWAWGNNWHGQIGNGTGGSWQYLRSPVPVSGFLNPPTAPTDLRATAVTGTQATLAWTDNSSNETWFALDRKTGSGGTWAQRAVVDPDVVTYTDTGLTPGTTYVFRVRAHNDAGYSPSSNELTVTATPTAAADFAVSIDSLNPGIPTANGTFDAVVTVRNQGTAPGVPGLLQVWANSATSQGCGARGDQSITLATSLAVGAGQQVTFRGLPAGAAGTKTLRVFVDSLCQTPESNEANNQSVRTYSVQAPTAAPDFRVTGIVLTPPVPPANGTFSAAVTVTNQSTTSGDGGYLDVWLNQPSVQTCGADGNAWARVGTLTPGENRTLTFTGLRAGVAGDRALRAFIDSQCQTQELNETNNQLTTAYRVGPSPDFVVSNITLTPDTPRADSIFSVTFMVRNQGSASGNGGFVDVWTNQPESQACGTDGSAYASVGTLNAGEGRTITISGLRARAAGNKTLRIFVENGCQTPEADESNNQEVRNYGVVP